MRRQFTASREELDALAVDRAAKMVRDIFVVLQKSGHASYVHDDGTPCTCDPGCDCHPPTRNEDPIVTGERGSWHLDTCPLSPKNRGRAQP